MRLTPRSIANSRPGDCSRCPIAIEARKQFTRKMRELGCSGVADAHVTNASLQIAWNSFTLDGRAYHRHRRTTSLSLRCCNWIRNFDQGVYIPGADGYPGFPELTTFLEVSALDFARLETESKTETR